MQEVAPHLHCTQHDQKTEIDSLCRNFIMSPVMYERMQVTKHLSERGIYRVQANRKVKAKMVIKLLQWMDKLCRQAFDFSNRTFQLSGKILLKYLSVQDQNPKYLQMVGCACLYLASKMSEKKIIAAKYYCDSSANIFNKEELEEKERQIFRTIEFNVNFSTIYDVIDFLRIGAKLQDGEKSTLTEAGINLVKNEQFWAFSDFHILLVMATQLRLEGKIPQKQDLLLFLNSSK